MKKALFVMLVGFLDLFAPLSLLGQSAERGEGALSRRLDSMEKRLQWLPSISGHMSLRYQYEDVSDKNSFDVRRVRLALHGAPTSFIDYRLQLELASTPKILDAYVRFKIRDWANFQIGQFKVPLSLENPYSPLKMEAIDNAQVITNLTGVDDIAGVKASGRDIGIAFYGSALKRDDFSVIEYSLGVFNGAGINRTDDNDSKDFAARLNVNPLSALTFSASCYLGYANRTTETGESYGMGRKRYGAGVRWDDRLLLVRAEYLYGKTGALESDGWYAIVGYWVTPKVEPVVRYETFRRDRTESRSSQTNYMVGVDYWPWDFLRFQFNYTLRTFAEPGKRNENCLSCQLSLAF